MILVVSFQQFLYRVSTKNVRCYQGDAALLKLIHQALLLFTFGVNEARQQRRGTYPIAILVFTNDSNMPKTITSYITSI